MSARRYDHELIAAGRRDKAHRPSLATRWQRAAPEFFAGLAVKGAQIVVDRTGDKGQATAGDCGAANVKNAGRKRQSEGRVTVGGAEWPLPEYFAGGEVDGG